MNSITLPITYPMMTTAAGYAGAMAILSAYSESKDWLYSHYIGIYAIQNMPADVSKEYWPLTGYSEAFFEDFDIRRFGHTINDGIFIDRERCPFLYTFEIPMSIVDANQMTNVNFVKHCLQNKMYVYAIVDQTDISSTNRHGEHPLLIYGYDNDRRQFLFGDFPAQSKYKFMECSESELESAFQKVRTTQFPLVKSFCAISFVPHGAFCFNMEYVRHSISRYIAPDSKQEHAFSVYADSYFTPLNWKTIVHSGVNFYNFLIEFMRIQKDLGMYPADPIPFHALYDHKAMMVNRLEYFLEKGYLNQSKAEACYRYREIKEQALVLRNSLLKYNVSASEALFSRISELVSKLRITETIMLKEIFDL